MFDIQIYFRFTLGRRFVWSGSAACSDLGMQISEIGCVRSRSLPKIAPAPLIPLSPTALANAIADTVSGSVALLLLVITHLGHIFQN